MDSIPNYEFHEIFDRISNNINFRGCISKLAIEIRLHETQEQCRKNYRCTSSSKERAKIKSEIIRYNNLLRHGFAKRTIEEANKDPNGLIAQTLVHGKIEANRRLHAQRMARMNYYRRNLEPWKRKRR